MRDPRYRNGAFTVSLAANVILTASALADDAPVIVTGTRLPQVTAEEVPSVDVVTRRH